MIQRTKDKSVKIFNLVHGSQTHFTLLVTLASNTLICFIFFHLPMGKRALNQNKPWFCQMKGIRDEIMWPALESCESPGKTSLLPLPCTYLHLQLLLFFMFTHSHFSTLLHILIPSLLLRLKKKSLLRGPWSRQATNYAKARPGITGPTCYNQAQLGTERL